MYRKCCVPECSNLRQDVKFHQFPRNEETKRQWLKFIRSENLERETKNMYVCHKHFEKKFITGTNRLKIGACPTLFSKLEISSGIASTVPREINQFCDKNYSRKRHFDHSYALAEQKPLKIVRAEVSDGMPVTPTSKNTAEAIAFFDDNDDSFDSVNELSPQEILAIGQKPSTGQKDDIFANTVVNNTKTLLPLNSLVSPNVLQLILLAQSGKDPVKDPKYDTEETVAVTLKRLILGRSCSLHVHRSLKSKTELLDGAISIGDGNAILAVVLFLIQTLNKKLVYELLSSRPIALNHYISFLQNEGKITELTDLLTMLGRSQEAAIYQFQHYVKTLGNNVDGLLKKLAHLMANHLNQPGNDTQLTKMVADYVKLLEWQKFANKPEIFNKSALYCLAYCCTHHWSDTSGNTMSPMTVCQRQQIPPLQYDWVVLNVHAKSEKWDIVENLFTKKDWFGRTTVSSHIPIETLLSRLSDLQASKRLLATCVNKIASADDRLRLAQMYKIESVVIETLAKQKDRVALTNYKMTLNPQSEVYILAENTLRDNAIKWKN